MKSSPPALLRLPTLVLAAAIALPTAVSRGGEASPGFTPEQEEWWAFQPVAEVTPPENGGGWARGEIDRFIARELDEVGLEPAPEARPAELVRRVFFDMHGLPPDLGEVDAFAADPSPQAYERLVDRLLASPRYGERWGQHWLDLVRYSESDGYNADAYRPHVWPYRDWVIRRLNEDVPYHQFVREQLAGDEIDSGDPETLVATAFLRHPIYEWNQRDVRGQWEIILTDITDTAGELFLGLSFGCARCHDHKFDPILQRDYHALRAFFAPVLWRDDLVLATEAERAHHAEAQAAWEEATADVRARIDSLTKPLLQPKVDRALARFTDDLQALVDKPRGERSALEQQLARLCERQLEYEYEHFDFAKTSKDPAAKEEWLALEKELRAFDHLKPAPLTPAFVATDAGRDAPVTRMAARDGDEVVKPAFPSILASETPAIEPVGDSTGRRSLLARWITDPGNPLTARVVVNRVWQYHFGRGIVPTASDFGKLGEPPTHPELLDWLAKRLVDRGWRLKQLHREILLSSTYRQTARVTPSELALTTDPENHFLWRFNPRRLDAEQARDAMLQVSGELDMSPGGLSEEASASKRRSVYTRKKRNNPDELLRCLDAPTGFASTSERQSTTTPTQALLLMNGEWTLERARALANRVTTVDQAWLRVLGRAPTAPERARASAYLDAWAEAGTGDGDGGADGFARASEFRPGSAHERIVVEAPSTDPGEGDEFSVEALVRLDSIDTAAAVRTIASRWTGEKDRIEAFGWRLGVTGEKSQFQPRNLIVQLVGWDANSNITYEVVASDIRIELGRLYHVAMKVSCGDGTVAFRVSEPGSPSSPAREATVTHTVRSRLGAGVAGLVVGGLDDRATAHQWDGDIEAIRVLSGPLAGGSSDTDPAHWGSDGVFVWRAGEPLEGASKWSGAPGSPLDPTHEAMADLCHILLNSNEFFYLH